MKRVSRVMQTTIDVLVTYDGVDRVIILDFLSGIKEINILKLGTTTSNDVIAKYLFVEEQDTIMKFIVTMLNVLREDREFFSKENSYINDITSVVENSGLFNNEYKSLVIGKEAVVGDFNELLSLYIMGAVPSRRLILGE